MGDQTGFEGLDMMSWVEQKKNPENSLSPSDFETWEKAQMVKNDYSALAMPIPMPAMHIGSKPLDSSAVVHSNLLTKQQTRNTNYGETAHPSKRNKQEIIVDSESIADGKRHLNKLAADKYRKKKRQQFEELSAKSQELENDNRKLTTKCSTLESEVKFMKELLLVTVRNSAKVHASTKPPQNRKGDGFFTMEEYAKAFMQKHVRVANERIRKLEARVQILLDLPQKMPR
eukprot:gene4318-6626_t